MRANSWPLRIGVVATWLAAAGLAITASRGEPVLNQVLSSATAVSSRLRGCVELAINFNIRVRYLSHFPVEGGSELRIRIEPIDPVDAERNIIVPRESIYAPSLPGAELRAIEFEANGSGPTVTVRFADEVAYNVAQGADFTSIKVRIAGPQAGGECRTSVALDPPKRRRKPTAFDSRGELAPGRTTDVDGLFQQARTAITREDYTRATQILAKLTRLPAHAHSAEAQELLGVVRERRGQLAQARAEYQAYLAAYPNGKGAARVRQRLAAIETATAQPKARLHRAKEPRAAVPATPRDNAADARPAVPIDEETAVADPSEFRWDFIGSLSEYYFLNQEFTRLKEFESRRETDDDDIFENSLLTSLDARTSAQNDTYRYAARFSGSHSADFLDDTSHDYRVSAAYGEAEIKPLGLEARVGRQSRHTGGVLGRFDGGLFSWQAREGTTLNLTAGSPVHSSRDEPFAHDQIFFGSSVDFEELFGGFDFTVFIIEQHAGSLVDRRAVGAEARYADEDFSAFGSIDYDVHFGEINSAIASGTYTFADRSTLSANADYVASPSLELSNALRGQDARSMDALRRMFTADEIEQLARDRTTRSASAGLSYSRPLNDMWQANVNVTVYHTGGNPASGGVAAMDAPRFEYFTSSQLVGTGVFTDGDIVSTTFRYANTASSDLYLLDSYIRYPATENLRLRPRIKVGKRELKRSGGEQLFFRPSITADFSWDRETDFEVEIGGTWSDRKTDAYEERSNEIYVIGGVRYAF